MALALARLTGGFRLGMRLLAILAAAQLTPVLGSCAASGGDDSADPDDGDAGGGASGRGGDGAGGGAASSGNGPGGSSTIDGEAPPPNAGTGGNTGEIPAEGCTIKKFPEQSEHACEGTPGYWGEALQKALWFFNVNKSGPGVSCTYVQWRGDAHVADAYIALDPNDPNGVDLSQDFIDEYRSVLDPDGDGSVDLSGGFHDAGDYIKFGLTTGFSASTIAWSLWEYTEAYRATGLEPEAMGILRWFADYLMRSTFLDEDGRLVAFAHQVGDATDHTCGWMPPELRLPEFCPRRAYFISEEKPAADVTASAAAALALTAVLSRDADAEYADECLSHAVALYDFAATVPDTTASDDGGLYTSEYSYDDLAWAALWLYEATDDVRYLDDTLEAGGWLEGFPGFLVSCLQWETSCWGEGWTHCWNSVRSGVFLKLAQLLSGPASDTPYGQYASAMRLIARDNSMRWAKGVVPMTPGGFSFFVSWGSGRYNSAAQFVALVYAKHFGAEDPAAADAIVPWAQGQMAYLLGDNPLGKSYMMGFTDNYALQPHHAAGHASTSGQPNDPPENRHIIWGALVNGPADQQDGHVDLRSDYGSNEVAIDYNASLVAALAAHYALEGQGQCPLEDFPPLEPPADEFYTQSKNNGDGDGCRSQVDIALINHSVHPPRYNEHLSVRYYFDISELQDQGKSVDEVTASLINDNGQGYGEPTSLSGPHPCELNTSTYYFELGYEGYKFWGELVQLKAPRTAIIEIGVDHHPDCIWDPGNDWSYEGLPSGDRENSPHITVYSEGELIWGEEPLCEEKETEDEPPVILF